MSAVKKRVIEEESKTSDAPLAQASSSSPLVRAPHDIMCHLLQWVALYDVVHVWCTSRAIRYAVHDYMRSCDTIMDTMSITLTPDDDAISRDLQRASYLLGRACNVHHLITVMGEPIMPQLVDLIRRNCTTLRKIMVLRNEERHNYMNMLLYAAASCSQLTAFRCNGSITNTNMVAFERMTQHCRDLKVISFGPQANQEGIQRILQSGLALTEVELHGNQATFEQLRCVRSTVTHLRLTYNSSIEVAALEAIQTFFESNASGDDDGKGGEVLPLCVLSLQKYDDDDDNMHVGPPIDISHIRWAVPPLLNDLTVPRLPLLVPSFGSPTIAQGLTRISVTYLTALGTIGIHLATVSLLLSCNQIGFYRLLSSVPHLKALEHAYGNGFGMAVDDLTPLVASLPPLSAADGTNAIKLESVHFYGPVAASVIPLLQQCHELRDVKAHGMTFPSWNAVAQLLQALPWLEDLDLSGSRVASVVASAAAAPEAAVALPDQIVLDDLSTCDLFILSHEPLHQRLQIPRLRIIGCHDRATVSRATWYTLPPVNLWPIIMSSYASQLYRIQIDRPCILLRPTTTAAVAAETVLPMLSSLSHLSVQLPRACDVLVTLLHHSPRLQVLQLTTDFASDVIDLICGTVSPTVRAIDLRHEPPFVAGMVGGLAHSYALTDDDASSLITGLMARVPATKPFVLRFQWFEHNGPLAQVIVALDKRTNAHVRS